MTICGLVLAGGHGRRLGGADKALLPLAGRPLLGWLLPRLAPQVDALAISANGDPARFAAFGLPVLPDPVVDQGPLSGLLAGLDWAAGQGAQALLTVPADTPFIPLDLATRLAPAPCCAESLGRAHLLVALWQVDCRDWLRDLLVRPGSRAVGRFAEAIGQRTARFDAVPDPFTNINTPEDLAEAASRLSP